MRKVYPLLILTFMFCQTIQAQESPIKHELKADFMQFFIFGNFGINYEMILPKNNQGLLLTYNYFEDDFFWLNPRKSSRLGVEYRMYFKEGTLGKGFYVGPFLKYRNKIETEHRYYLNEDTPEEETVFDGELRSNGLSFGLSTGYKWIAREHFVFEIGLGLGRYIMEKFEYSNSEFEDYYKYDYRTDWMEKVELNGFVGLGYRF